MSDRNDEERVAGVGDTGQSVVPGSECSQDTESTTGSKASDVSMLEVRDTEHQERKIEGEEEEEKGNGRAQRAKEQDEGKDEPALNKSQSSVLNVSEAGCSPSDRSQRRHRMRCPRRR